MNPSITITHVFDQDQASTYVTLGVLLTNILILHLKARILFTLHEDEKKLVAAMHHPTTILPSNQLQALALSPSIVMNQSSHMPQVAHH